MGLLDNLLNSEDGRLGLGLLAAGSARSDGAGMGQRLFEAVGSVDQWKQQQAQAKRMKMQEEFQAFQMQQAMAQAEAQKAERARQQTIQQGMGAFFKPRQQALAPLMGDSATGILPSQGRAAVAPSFDAGGAAEFLAKNGAYEDALKFMPKPKELAVNKLDVKDFAPASVQKFAQSGNYGDLVRMDKLHMGTEGGDFKGRNPFTGEEVVSSKNSKSFADANAERNNQLGWANFGLSKQRLNFEQTGGGEGGASQAGFNKQFGKPQAGYRWKADGSMEFIPGGPADQKAQAQKGGEGTVGGIVADLRDKYTQLNTGGGIVNDDDNFVSNMGSRVASTGLGQTLGQAFGTKNQTSRDSIAMTRPLLLQAIMKATGMSAKQMDSNAELKLYLATATDPTKGIQANLEALDRIESLYGGGNEKFKTNTPQASTQNGWSMQKVN